MQLFGRKLGRGSGPFRWKGTGFHLTQFACAVAYLHAKYRLHPSSRLAAINMGRKFVGALLPFWGGGAGSLSNTKSRGPRPTSIPSDILIHAAILPQQILAENWGLCPFGFIIELFSLALTNFYGVTMTFKSRLLLAL